MGETVRVESGPGGNPAEAGKQMHYAIVAVFTMDPRRCEVSNARGAQDINREDPLHLPTKSPRASKHLCFQGNAVLLGYLQLMVRVGVGEEMGPGSYSVQVLIYMRNRGQPL